MMPRTNHLNYAIQMQINDNHDLPQILFSQDQDLNTRSLNLKPGHVYEIEVSADGQVSTSGFKKLSLEVRNCRLEDEVEKGSQFKLYSQQNCRYILMTFLLLAFLFQLTFFHKI